MKSAQYKNAKIMKRWSLGFVLNADDKISQNIINMIWLHSNGH